MHVIHLKVHGRIESDGRLRVDVPTQLPAGEADIAITISAAGQATNGGYDFSELAGRLSWQGDPIAEQRVIRDEW